MEDGMREINNDGDMDTMRFWGHSAPLAKVVTLLMCEAIISSLRQA
jgi:hypothetical protein